MTRQTHPSRDELAAYLAGKLNAVDSDHIQQHLAECPSCCYLLDAIPTDDTIVAALRQQDTGTSAAPDVPTGNTIAPSLAPQEVEETRAPHDATTKVAGLDADQWKLPPELRDDRRYRIVELLGHGGMGDVYRAEHKVMNRQVALKVIKPQLVQNDAAVRRFRREVQAAARLHHGNIVTAYDAEQAGDLHYLVMEFVDGENLDEVIRKRGPLPVEEACEYVRQTAEGLQYAHQLGMVHRDIKPHNLMVQKKDEGGGMKEEAFMVKILDFGLAGFASETAAEDVEEKNPGNRVPAAEVLTQLTQVGAMMGTPDYIAPEQAQDAHAADIRADIYSLGCTFYALLSGGVPFGKGSVLDKVKAHTEQDPAPLAEFRDDVPAEVEAIVLKMMAKDPAARYQTPQEVVEALRSFVDQRIDERLRDDEAGRPPGKPLGPTTGESDDEIRKWYGKVADVMLSVGLINIVTSLIFACIIVWLAFIGEDYRSFATHWVTLVCIASLVPGILLLTVVGNVRRMESYGSLLFAVLLCMWPTTGAFLGIPIGLVTLFHLLSPECRRPLGTRLKSSFGDGLIFLGLLACPVILVLAALVYYTQPGITAVTFEIDDPDLAVEFQFQRITAENDGRSIQILPDDQQQFTIERDGQAMETATFRLSQGQHATLRIVSADGIPVVASSKADVAIHQQRILEPAVEKGISLAHTYQGHTAYIDAAAFIPGGLKLLSGGADGVRNWGLSKHVASTKWKEESHVFAIAASPDKKFIALGTNGGNIVLYDTRGRVSWTAHEAEEGRRDLNRVLALVFSPDSTRLLSGGDDGLAKEWQIREGNVPQQDEIRVLGEKGPRRNIESLAYSADGRRIMTAGYDKVVRFYDAETGELQTEIKNAAERADLSPDGRLVISGTQLYDAASGQALRSLAGAHTHRIGSVAFTRDGRHVVGGLTDSTIRVWNTATGEEVARGKHPTQVTNKIALSPDGYLVASWRNKRGEDGNKLFVWRLPESVWPQPSEAHDVLPLP